MNTTVVSLKNLYVQLGGALADTYNDIADGIAVSNYVTIPDCIDAINALIESGATKELPAVTISDSGKMLAVDESGLWAKSDVPTELPKATAEDSGKAVVVDENGGYILDTVGGGGAETFVVTFTVTSASNATADKTKTEVLSALNSGKTVVGVYKMAGGGNDYRYVSYSLYYTASILQFYFFSTQSLGQSRAFVVRTVSYTGDDTITTKEESVSITNL